MNEWRMLAKGEYGVSVARCPEGHIHLDMERGVTLRFDDGHFLAFARAVAAAATAVGGRDWLSAIFGSADSARLLN